MTVDKSKLGKLADNVCEKLDELRDKINAKLAEMAREVLRDQEFGVSVINIQTKVIPDKLDADLVTIHTAIKLDSSSLGLEFNGSGGMVRPQGGYTLTVDLPYRYKVNEGDNILDVASQEFGRLKTQLKCAFKAVTYNPERDPENLPPPGTTITRNLLVGFKAEYALENLGLGGEVTSQFSVQHRFGEAGKIQLSISENRLKKIGGKPHFVINDLRLYGGATVENHSERGVQFEVDVIRPGDGDARQREKEDRRLLAQTVRIGESGLPQAINYRVAEELRGAVRTARVTKELDTGVGAGYSFGAIGLSTGYDRNIQSVYEARHVEASRKEADNNLAVWIEAVEADDSHKRSELLCRLREAAGRNGALFQVTSRNDDATNLSAQLGKSFGASHVRLQMAATFGKRIKDCNTIKLSLQISPDGRFRSLTYDALSGKQFISTLELTLGLKVQDSLKAKIREHTDPIISQIEDSFSVGKWLENLDLKDKIGDKLYDIVKEYVEEIALSFAVTREHGKWGRIVLKASGLCPVSNHDILIARMLGGDFSDAVASGLHLTTNTIDREEFKSEVKFDFASLLSFSMMRSHCVIDEQTTWEFDGKRFQIREMTGEACRKVEGLNTTNFQVRTYYIASVGEDGLPFAGLPTQVITTVVYTSKENEVAGDKEASRLVGMAEALNFDTFVPFVPVRATGVRAQLLRLFRRIEPLGGGQIAIATATSTAGHIRALTRTPDEAQKLGEEVAQAILGLGDSPTPQLAAQVYDLGGIDEPERLEIANFINNHFWSPGLGGFAVIGFNHRIDPDEIVKTRAKIQEYLDHPKGSKAQIEADRIKAILPEGGVQSLPDGFILTAVASAILDAGLNDPDNEPSIARLTYEDTFHRRVEDEKFIREMGGWARNVTEDPNVAAMRARLLKGEIPNDEEVLALLGNFMELATESTQGSTAIFSDDKDLLNLARWSILHAMAGEANVIGMVRVQAKLGSFAAGSSPDLTPAEIDRRCLEIQHVCDLEKQRLDQEAHGC